MAAVGALDKTLNIANAFGEWLPQLGLRLLLAYEFWESGVEKLNGENWFAEIQDKFPFPLNVVPPDVSWFLATWVEVLGAIGLVPRTFHSVFQSIAHHSHHHGMGERARGTWL